MKKNIKYIIPLAAVLTLVILVKITEQEEIDWSASFTKNDKIPYGSYVLFDMLPQLFPAAEISVKELPVYNILKEDYYYNTNYIFINDYFSPDELDTEYLLEYVFYGNNVFISAGNISGPFADTLKINTYFDFYESDSVTINFTDTSIADQRGYTFQKGNFRSYFSVYDTANAEVLGTDSDDRVNFIKIDYGEGSFFINTAPYAFTNYYLIKSEYYDYAFKALSYLSQSPTFWDEYYKTGNKFAATPLRYVISQKALSWAYYTLLAAIVLYIIIFSRRKQRIIPVIKPFTNSSVDFIKTISNVYLDQKNHKNIAAKKILYFMDFIRTKYLIKSLRINEETLKKISEKSSIPLSRIKSLFADIALIQESSSITKEQLVSINYKIENFYKKAE